jgi:hypothetical protein
MEYYFGFDFAEVFGYVHEGHIVINQKNILEGFVDFGSSYELYFSVFLLLPH